jgi:hypothetical protein
MEGSKPVGNNAIATKPGSRLLEAKGLKIKQPRINNFE